MRQCHRIDVVEIGRAGEIPGVVGDRRVGGLADRVGDDADVAAVVLDPLVAVAGDCERGAEGQWTGRREVESDPSADAPVPGGFHDAVLVEPGPRDAVPEPFVAAVHRQLGAAHRRRPEHPVLPVGVDCVGDTRLAVVVLAVPVVDRALVHDLEPLAGVEERQSSGRRLGADEAVEVDRGPPGLAALGSDHDDAVRAARSVDRRRGRVLQDVHGLDVVRAEPVDRRDALAADAQLRDVACDHGNAVHHVERIAVGRDGRRAPDSQADRVAGIAGVLDHLHARRLALEGGVHARDRLEREVLRVDRGHGRAQLAAELGAVADRHHFLELGDAGRQHEVGRRLAFADLHRALQRAVPDHLNPDAQQPRAEVGQAILAVGVGLGAPVSPDDADRGARHRAAGSGVGDRAAKDCFLSG